MAIVFFSYCITTQYLALIKAE